MPKAPSARSTRSTAARASPTKSSKPKTSKAPKASQSNSDDDAHEPKQHYNKSDPKASHLYTDDNPATTLHGTGFKDAATAQKTLELVTKRSLTYQFQTINTMFHRAKNHPHSDGNADIEAAMSVFRKWLDETYPRAKEERKDFKPLLSKKTVQRYLDTIKKAKVDSSFAEVYVSLPPRKRLANVLVDEKHPEEPDWEKNRENKLIELTKKTGEKPSEDELWEDEKSTEWHLECIAWAWSPVSERKL
ncbi:MAG: hypothetical protein Q9162_006168 [Coniocarpon cinnabarinum]